MSRKNASPNQIIRKDGRNCFVEALKSSFAIGKVNLKFVTYDTSRKPGEKCTNEVDIYIDFAKFNQLFYDMIEGKALINEVRNEKKIADQQTQATGQKVWAKQTTIHQGGTSAASLQQKGKSRPDGKSEARVLKFFAGDKLPFMFRAEKGPGETTDKGLIVPKYGNKPEQVVQIGMTADDLKEFMLTIHQHVQAYIASVYAHEKMETLEAKVDTLTVLVSKVADSMGIPSSDIIRQCEEQRKQQQQQAYNNNNQYSKQNNYNTQYQQDYNTQYQQSFQNSQPPQPQYEQQPFFP